jgi:hypothetical protein
MTWNQQLPGGRPIPRWEVRHGMLWSPNCITRIETPNYHAPATVARPDAQGSSTLARVALNSAPPSTVGPSHATGHTGLTAVPSASCFHCGLRINPVLGQSGGCQIHGNTYCSHACHTAFLQEEHHRLLQIAQDYHLAQVMEMAATPSAWTATFGPGPSCLVCGGPSSEIDTTADYPCVVFNGPQYCSAHHRKVFYDTYNITSPTSARDLEKALDLFSHFVLDWHPSFQRTESAMRCITENMQSARGRDWAGNSFEEWYARQRGSRAVLWMRHLVTIGMEYPLLTAEASALAVRQMNEQAGLPAPSQWAPGGQGPPPQ